MAKRVLKANLSVKGINNLKNQLLDYKNKLQQKTELFVKKLADAGVEVAKAEIANMDAVYTGELYSSVQNKPGTAIKNGSQWIVFTDCPWAVFVEFGTGAVGAANPHPDTSIVGWKYDVNSHGEAGWFYFKDGEWHWTKGMMSRPFMYSSVEGIMRIITKTAKEVFGS